MKNKTLLINISVLIITIMILFLAAEAGMRIIGKIYDIDFTIYMKELKNANRGKGYIKYDPVLLNRLVPNSQALATTSDFSVRYKINSKGFRDKEYKYKKPEDKIRFAAFGDSNTFGHGINYGSRFTDIAEKELNNIEILNFGVPGYGYDQMLILFSTEGLKYEPDYLIIFANKVDFMRFSTNIYQDGRIVMDNPRAKEQRTSRDTIYIKRNDSFFEKNDNLIMDNSYFLSYINYHYSLIKLKQKFVEQDKKYWKNVDEEGKKDLNETNFFDSIYRTILIIEEFHEICKENNIKMIIINIDGEKILSFRNLDDDIIYYDLSGTMAELYEDDSAHFKYDLHYNENTNKLIGKILKEIIVNETQNEK